MSEAVRAVIARLFEEEGMDYVQCGYFDFNTVSKAMQEKLGFTHLITMTIDFRGEMMTTVENILWKGSPVERTGPAPPSGRSSFLTAAPPVTGSAASRRPVARIPR